MKITKIEKQKRNLSRYNIFIEGEFSFGLYDETLLKYGLRTGDDLTDSKVNKIRREDELSFGKKSAYNFLSRRPRTVKEVEKKLMQLEISPQTIEEVVDYMKELGYLNDDEFTKGFIEAQIRRKPTGRRVIKSRLKIRGIENETADESLNENYSSDIETIKAKEAALKYLKKNEKKVTDKFEMRSKLFRHLVSRGFPMDTVILVIKEFN